MTELPAFLTTTHGTPASEDDDYYPCACPAGPGGVRDALLSVVEGHAFLTCPICCRSLFVPEAEDGVQLYMEPIPVRATYGQRLVPADSFSGTEVVCEWIDVELPGGV